MSKTEDMKKIGALLMQLGDVFGREVTEVTISAYWSALKDLGAAAIEAACARAMAESKFFPKPVELRAMVQGDSIELKAADAWERTMVLARNSREAEHEDPLAEAAVRRIGGWIELGKTAVDRLPWLRRDFVDGYIASAKAQDAKDALEGADVLQIGSGR